MRGAASCSVIFVGKFGFVKFAVVCSKGKRIGFLSEGSDALFCFKVLQHWNYADHYAMSASVCGLAPLFYLETCPDYFPFCIWRAKNAKKC